MLGGVRRRLALQRVPPRRLVVPPEAAGARLSSLFSKLHF
jgi:hypothetical protein